MNGTCCAFATSDCSRPLPVATGGTAGTGGAVGTGGKTSTGTGGQAGGGASSTGGSSNAGRVNILFLLDKTGSMGDDPNGGWVNAASRWNPVVTTLRSFFQEQQSSGIYASLSFLPADGDITNACKVSSYEPPATNSVKVPLTLLDTVGSQLFLTRLCDPTVTPLASTCIVPAGGTVTRPALQGTLAYAATVQQTYPDSKSAIVFLTDGEPGFGYVSTGSSKVNNLHSCDDLTNGCPLGPAGASGTGTCTDAYTEVQNVADVLATAPPKTIHVIGIGDLSEPTMTQWADVTGNAAVALQGMNGPQVAATLHAALDSLVMQLMQ
jgi:hypothetical protein